ncbi:glycosyltransferase [Mycobacterium simiae]|uniref:glycosyltransferase n=1 Tax=Mycobacterium simiae TaxID=1784 RepID=UPI00261CE92D|nr:glycosyltransferase [Mycobacterium simiae]
MQIAIVHENDAWADSRCVLGDRPSDDTSQFCAALASQGYTVTAYSRGRRKRSSAAKTGYRIVASDIGPPPPAAPAEVLPFVTEWAAQLGELWASNPPEIVHAFGWLAGLAAQLAARRQQLATVQTFCGLAATIGPDTDHCAAATERARIEPLLARNASWVTGGSSREIDTLSRLRRRRAQISLLPKGIDSGRYFVPEPRPAEDRLLRIVQLDRDPLPWHGFDRVIRALPKLRETELVLGQTEKESARHTRAWDELRRLARDFGVSDRVQFSGHVVAREIPSLLHSADVVACTPRQAPHATTALAAMASGVVVVGVAVDALVDVVVNGVTGSLVSPSRPHELTAALKVLTSSRFQRESMGSAGRSRLLSRFTWDRIALDASTIYESISAQRHGPAIATDSSGMSEAATASATPRAAT